MSMPAHSVSPSRVLALSARVFAVPMSKKETRNLQEAISEQYHADKAARDAAPAPHKQH